MRFAALAMATALAVAACGGDGDAGRYSEGVRTSYLDACTTSQNEAFCECTLEEYEKRYTEEEFLRYAITAAEEQPADFVEIALTCLAEADLEG